MATTDVEVIRYVADVSQLEKSQEELERNLRDVAKEAEKSAKSVSKLTTEEKDLSSTTKNLNNDLDKTDKSLNKTSGSVTSMGSIVSKVIPILTAFFAVGKIIDFGKAVFATRAEFQKLEAVLTNTLGSKSLAQKALSDIQDFASKTPFAVQELTQSYVKLANQGFKPTVNQLRQLGDLAASTGKGFDQLTEAIIDAQTGEFERLKEFGIRAQKEGNKVSFTFKGVKTQVDFTNTSIRNYITSLGDIEGVTGSMAAISGTLTGQVSNLGDSFDTLLNIIGQRFESVFSGTLSIISKVVDFIADAVRSSDQVLDELQNKFVSDQAEKLEKARNNEIEIIVRTGEKRIDAERQVYERASKEADDLANQIEANNKQRAEQILKDQETLKKRKDAGQFGAETIELERTIQQNKKLQRLYENNYALQIFLRDDYAARVKDIDGKIAQNEEAELKAKIERDKKLKQLQDEEIKRLAELERQRLAYNDFNISLIENQFDREAATKKEQFFRTIEDSKKNIGEEINTNSEMYKLLSDRLIKDLEDIETRRKELEKKQREERTKAIIDGVNAEIKAREEAGNSEEAYELKKLRDNYEKQLAEGVKYNVAKEQLDKDSAQKSFEVKRDTLNDEIALLEEEIVKNSGNNDAIIALKKDLQKKINEIDQLEFDERERLRKKDLEAEKTKAAVISELKKAGLQIAVALANDFVAQNQENQTQEIEEERYKLETMTNNRMADLDRQVELGYLSQKKADQLKDSLQKQQQAKEAKLKARQFEVDKQAALSRALISAGQAVITTLASIPYPANLIAAGSIAALTAIEISAIERQRAPKFKDGSEIGIKGAGTETSDSIPAWLSRGETVLNAKETRELKPALLAYRSGGFASMAELLRDNYPSSFMPAFERNELSLKQKREYQSAEQRRREKQAMVDMSKTERLLKRNGSVRIKNVDEMSSSIATKISSTQRYEP